MNVLQNEQFLNSAVTTDFIFKNPELFDIKPTQNRAHKLMYYLAEVVVNGPCTPLATDMKPAKIEPVVPEVNAIETPVVFLGNIANHIKPSFYSNLFFALTKLQ